MALAVSMVTLDSGITLSCASRGGPADPAVVLLPGPTDSWRSYEPVLDRFPASMRAIAVSQRGHGDSDKPLAGYGVEHFAADVSLLLDALAVERALLVGHSGSCWSPGGWPSTTRRASRGWCSRHHRRRSGATPACRLGGNSRHDPAGPDRPGLRLLLRRRHVGTLIVLPKQVPNSRYGDPWREQRYWGH